MPATIASDLGQDNGQRLDCFLTRKVSRFSPLACDLILRLPRARAMLDSR
jgi:hypothetical protein